MRYLVTGAGGFVGYYLCGRFSALGHTVIPATHSRKAGLAGEISLDICDSGQVQRAISSASPDVVVHCAAMTNVDECERRPEEAKKANFEATASVSDAAKGSGAKLVFLSTSFVFGTQGGALSEDSPPSPANVYGLTKLQAEAYVRSNSPDSLILRIDQPFGAGQGWQKPDMVSWVLGNLEEGKPFGVFSDWFNQPTYLPDFFSATMALVEKGKLGVFHCTGQDKVSRFEWARMAAEIFGFNPELAQPVLSSSAHLPAQRPNVLLSCEKLARETGLRPTPLRSAILEIKNSIDSA